MQERSKEALDDDRDGRGRGAAHDALSPARARGDALLEQRDVLIRLGNRAFVAERASVEHVEAIVDTANVLAEEGDGVSKLDPIDR